MRSATGAARWNTGMLLVFDIPHWLSVVTLSLTHTHLSKRLDKTWDCLFCWCFFCYNLWPTMMDVSGVPTPLPWIFNQQEGVMMVSGRWTHNSQQHFTGFLASKRLADRIHNLFFSHFESSWWYFWDLTFIFFLVPILMHNKKSWTSYSIPGMDKRPHSWASKGSKFWLKAGPGADLCRVLVTHLVK